MSDEDFAPRRISDRTLSVRITGYLVPWVPEGPLLLAVPGTSDLFVAVFSTKRRLQACCLDYQLEYASIKKVTDGREFLAEVLPHFRVLIDPHRHTNGLLRYTEPFTFGGSA